jgi:hypothetical protein
MDDAPEVLRRAPPLARAPIAQSRDECHLMVKAYGPNGCSMHSACQSAQLHIRDHALLLAAADFGFTARNALPQRHQLTFMRNEFANWFLPGGRHRNLLRG